MPPSLTRQEAERLVNTYADLILRLSYTYLSHTHDAQDICQTVFLKLIERRPAFASSEHEKAWIIRTTINACKDHLKSHWRKTTVPIEAARHVPAPAAEPGSILASVNLLPPKYRAVIYLHYYEGYQAAEIGEILGVPLGTVHTRLARGRAKLRTLLGGTEYERQSV